MTAEQVNPAKAEHRTLRFSSLDEMFAEASRCAQAAQRGKLRTSANWSAGQTLGHLASWINYGFDGPPRRPPFFVRWIGPFLLKKRMLRGPMARGVRIPGVREGTFATDDKAPELGLECLRASIDRLRESTPSRPNPILGRLTRDEWISLHLRHAELHLGYLHPDSTA